MKSFRVNVNGESLLFNEGEKYSAILKKDYINEKIPITLVKQRNKYYEFTDLINNDGDIELINISDPHGKIAYSRTLQFVCIKATLDLFKDARINIEHSISKGTFGEIHKEKALDEEDILKIKKKMQEIINKNIIIEKIKMPKKEAIDIFKFYKMQDKVDLLHWVQEEYVNLYKLEDRYDYFYGDMAYSTGVLKYFDLLYYNPGFILMVPSHKEPTVVPVFKEQKKLFNVFRENETWLNILGTPDVGSLDYKLGGEESSDIIRVSEALHEKKIAQIADMISERKEVKIVLVAGPSSSGKTTFSKRLSIQLRVNGYIPIAISLDDYFINRIHTPLDEEGKPDFESINALDLELFNKNLYDILEGEEVEIPSYNFKIGEREWLGNKIKLPDNGVLVIEGIHGLNSKLTEKIPSKNKFKVYISALTQLNLDNHNRIPTTDVRKIRRIVRDSLSRGYGAEQTLEMWSSIKRGEEKNIFVYQEEADVMFNSTLVYELAALKEYALRELEKVDKNSSVYYEAKRIINTLKFFVEVKPERVPENSILREFIGGSCFYKY
ncbi:nucleoside kinase [Clostridium perfringens]|uniref:nucleoside kinase n=1 Tax=Clostridium perfringens TaxID=1502 RepID=UPI001CCAF368|nr:nucleoside kinase [Clostridium perfringens]MDK0908391.1 nucleoside kinase [Clostridium perfringens]MDV5103850.1 nucleoside kinase [Clostridium perfringens]MDZ4906590.1 nucleoside kinase [Clostridium perfringens]UBK25052.1 nucleoside kinase [Clostridium perfringens]